MNDRFQILCLDGGGIKGLFSAAVLAFLEEDHNINIINHFDLIVGTSTGGIIALALGMGMSPRDIVHFYVQEGPKIFPINWFLKLRHLIKNKFSSNYLVTSLIDCFGDTRLADSKKMLVIPSYNIGEDDVYIFKTPHHQRFKRDWKVPMWKVAMATSAAPTYFPSFRQIDHLRLIDGGVWANNPTIVGIAEAVSVLEVPINAIKVLSLGTTDEIKGRPVKLDYGGIFQWKGDAINVIMRGQSIGAHNQALHLLGKDKIFRLDPKVPEGLFKLDKLSEEALISKASHESRHFSPQFYDSFCSYISPEFNPIHK
jgi:patatin-like phospholipase/acyl hydrolase